MKDTCDICGHHYGPGLLTRVLVGDEWVWMCVGCREEGTYGDPDDRAAATLAGIRERLNGSWTNVAVRQVWVDDAPRLFAAAEAVLKLADDWDAKAATLTAAASRDRGPSRMTRAMLNARVQVLQDCTQALRETITAELAKGDGNHG